MSNTQVFFFGKLTDITGSTAMHLPAVADTDQLQQHLQERYPLLRQATYVITVNKKVIRQCTPLPKDAEVALLPPFSGG